MDVAVRLLIETLLAAPAVTAVVGGRVYKGHLATIPQPTYPCLTLSRPPGGSEEPTLPLATWSLYVGACSTLSYDEAWQLGEAAFAVLKHLAVAQGGRRWVVHPDRAPVETFDDTERPVYMVTRVYEVHQLG